MDLVFGILFLAATITFAVVHVVLLVHVARTRTWSVVVAALLVPPVAPLSCAGGDKSRFAKAWFLAVLAYAVLLVLSRR